MRAWCGRDVTVNWLLATAASIGEPLTLMRDVSENRLSMLAATALQSALVVGMYAAALVWDGLFGTKLAIYDPGHGGALLGLTVCFPLDTCNFDLRL